MFDGKKPTQAAMDRMKEILGWMDSWLEKSGFICGGEKATVADIAILAT
jgi:glutathione S-transferase